MAGGAKRPGVPRLAPGRVLSGFAALRPFGTGFAALTPPDATRPPMI